MAATSHFEYVGVVPAGTRGLLLDNFGGKPMDFTTRTPMRLVRHDGVPLEPDVYYLTAASAELGGPVPGDNTIGELHVLRGRIVVYSRGEHTIGRSMAVPADKVEWASR